MELYPVVWARLVSHLCLTVSVTAVSAHPRRFLRWVYRSGAVGSSYNMFKAFDASSKIVPLNPTLPARVPFTKPTLIRNHLLMVWWSAVAVSWLQATRRKPVLKNRTECIPTMQTVSLIAGLLRKAGHCSVVSQLVASGVVLAWSLQGPIMVTVSGQVIGHCSQLIKPHLVHIWDCI